MAYKVRENEERESSLDKTIVNIVSTMQPMSSDEILLEIEEEGDCIISKIEVNKHLEKMLEKHILTRIELQDDKVVYMMASQRYQ